MLPETAAERCEWLLKLAEIPPQLAAASDLRAAFCHLRFSHLRRFLTLGFNFVVAA